MSSLSPGGGPNHKWQEEVQVLSRPGSKGSKTMADRKTELVNPRTLTDEQIVSERKFPRRSFLTAAGVVLIGGAAALVSGVGAAQNTAPAKKEDYPDKKKDAGSKSGKAKTDKQANSAKAKGSAKDQKAKDQDPDKAKSK
jgi:hypothetical protein